MPPCQGKCNATPEGTQRQDGGGEHLGVGPLGATSETGCRDRSLEGGSVPTSEAEETSSREVPQPEGDESVGAYDIEAPRRSDSVTSGPHGQAEDGDDAVPEATDGPPEESQSPTIRGPQTDDGDVPQGDGVIPPVGEPQLQSRLRSNSTPYVSEIHACPGWDGRRHFSIIVFPKPPT